MPVERVRRHGRAWDEIETRMQTSPRSGTPRLLTRQRVTGSLRVAATACALLLGQALSAQAQYVFEDEILPPRAVAWRLGDRGFTGIGRPRFDGRAYIVEAFDPRGDRVRLVVAPDSGAIIGRQRLDAPLLVERPARPAAGYGWTDEDYGSARGREVERLVPPGRIPMPEDRGVYAARPLPPVSSRPVEPARREPMREPTREASVADPAGNPLGLNPDAAGRQPAPRRTTRAAPSGEKAASPRLSDVKPPEKPAARLAPEAPRPAQAKADTQKPEASRTETAKVDANVDPKADAPKGPSMPAAQTPPPAKAADLKPADKPADPAWKDPPEAKRNVRVIGGATIVPGTTDKDAGTGN